MPVMGIGDKSPGKWFVDGNLPGLPELFPECGSERLNPGSRAGGEASRPLLSLFISIIPEADERPLFSCIPVRGGTLGEHGMAIHRKCDPARVEQTIDLCVVREIMVHEQMVNDPDVREGTVTVYRCPVNSPEFDHAVRVPWGKMVRGPVQIHRHPGDIGIKIRDDPVMELVQRPGCRVAVVSELRFGEREQERDLIRHAGSTVGHGDKERVSSHQASGWNGREMNIRERGVKGDPDLL